MITVYTGKDKSSRSAVSWFLWQNIEIKVCTKAKMEDETIQSICEEFSCKVNMMFSKRSRLFKDIAPFFEQYTFEEKVDLLVKERRLLRTPIIYSKNKLLIGFNEEQIRKFIPREQRKARYNQLYQEDVIEYLNKKKVFVRK
ncbi:ArsC/Spx/MgsR family protein [Enterococcus faecalis]|uniref:ArsC/Spx/MgsR family protein n=1 Tax=Enterococcus TaxID=1350 RepID=UPI00070B7E8A|nr:ArsC/Spx/MgsR family protein [Enterococcus faecalis]KXF71661.1 hypothetical protein AQ486_03500 [Enterococcus faecalis]KXF73963.1 hypothetical protein AQ487_03850 [Enterococcus faecalis]